MRINMFYNMIRKIDRNMFFYYQHKPYFWSTK